MELYGPLIETVFRRYGVPVFLGEMSDILQKPVISLITAALDTVAGEYRYEDLFRYLKTGLTDLTDDERDRLENYALKWNLRGSQWKQKGDWTMHPQGYGLPWSEGDRSALEELNALRRKVIRPLEKLRLGADRTGRGQTMALYQFLEEIGLPRRLLEREEALRPGESPPWRRSTASYGTSCATPWSSAPGFWAKCRWSGRSMPGSSPWCSPSTA